MREKGEVLPISIGTALALEKIVGEPLAGYNELRINLRTLFRNFHDSYKDVPKEKQVSEEFIDELKQISEILVELRNKGYRIVLYLNTLKSIRAIFKHASIKEATTKNQLDYERLETHAINEVLKIPQIKIEVNDILLKGKDSSAIIITNYPIDLLSAYSFRKLLLLESHTGQYKEQRAWIFKLSKNPSYENLPFNALTMQIIGDGSVCFKSMGAKFTNILLELAKTNRWHRGTALKDMRVGIQRLPDKFAVKLLISMTDITLK